MVVVSGILDVEVAGCETHGGGKGIGEGSGEGEEGESGGEDWLHCDGGLAWESGFKGLIIGKERCVWKFDEGLRVFWLDQIGI